MKYRFKQILRIILSILTMQLISCTPKSDSRLSEVERLVEIYPDSALMILNSIDEKSLSKEDDRALYGLLVTEAMDESRLKPDNDSLITPSVDYYTAHKDIPHQIKSIYYQGRVFYHQGDKPKSLVSFLEAKELGEKYNESFWTGMACLGVSQIYHDEYNSVEELLYARKGYDFLSKIGKQPFLNYAMLDLGRAMSNSGHSEGLDEYLKQISDSAYGSEDHYLLYYITRLRLTEMLTNGKYEEALPVSEKIMNDELVESSDSLTHGIILIYNGRIDEAKDVIESISGYNSAVLRLLKYKFVHSNDEDYIGTIRDGETIDSLADNEFKKSNDVYLTQTVMDYFQLKKELDNESIKLAKLRTVLTLTISIIVIMIFGLSAFSIYKRKNNVIEEKIILAEQLQEELAKSRNENSDSLKIIKSLTNFKYGILDDLSVVVMTNKESTKARQKIADLVTNMIEDLSIESDKISNLEKQVNDSHGGLMSDFRKDVEGLKEIDYRLYLFCVLGLSTATISLLLKEDKIGAVYNRKRRLKDKIKGLDENKRDRYLQWL